MKQRPKYRGIDNQNDCEKDKNSDEEMEMSSKSYNNQKTTEITLQDGDTLQALSIRYHCPIAELKRLNNLHKENEIFARRSIKVPYRHFLMPTVHKSGDNSPDANLAKDSVDVDAILLKQKLSTVSLTDSAKNGSLDHKLIDLSCNGDNESNFNQIIFNTTIKQKEEINEEIEEYSDEEIQLLPHTSTAEVEQITVETAFSCNGADGGLSWPILLGIILVVAFLGPLIYIFYIAEHPEKYHNHNR